MTRRILMLLLTTVIMSGLWVTSAADAAPALQDDNGSLVTIYFFWGEGCPHCAEAKPFLEDLVKRYPEVRIESFEVYNSADNQALFKEMAAAHGFEPRYVPTIFVGDEHWEGFAGAMGTSIERGVKACLAEGCRDTGAGVVPGHEAAPVPTAMPEATRTNAPESPVSTVPITIFWGDTGCEQCEATEVHHESLSGFAQLGSDAGGQALSFLMSLEAAHPDLEVIAYEVWITSANASIFRQFATMYGVEPRGVPMIFVGDRVWEGFDEEIAAEVTTYVLTCLDVGCLTPEEIAAAASVASVAAVSEPVEAVGADPDPSSSANHITLPVVGAVDLGS